MAVCAKLNTALIHQLPVRHMGVELGDAVAGARARAPLYHEGALTSFASVRKDALYESFG